MHYYYAISIPFATNNANIRIDNNNKRIIVSYEIYFKPCVENGFKYS